MRNTNATDVKGQTQGNAAAKETAAAPALQQDCSAIMSRKQAAQFLGVCVATLDRLGIPKTRIRRRVFYSPQTLARWIERNTEKAKRGKA